LDVDNNRKAGGRRKSFLCWAPDVIFNEKEDSDCIEVFPGEIQVRLEQQCYSDQVTVTLRDKVITALLIFVTAVSVCFLFWYQNFGKGN